MSWLLAACISCIAAEIFLHLPIAAAAAAMRRESRKAGRVIASRGVSDHWKERMTRFYAKRMGLLTLRLCFQFAILASAIVLCLTLVETMVPDAAPFLSSAEGMAFGAVIACLYIPAKKRLARS